MADSTVAGQRRTVTLVILIHLGDTANTVFILFLFLRSYFDLGKPYSHVMYHYEPVLDYIKH